MIDRSVLQGGSLLALALAIAWPSAVNAQVQDDEANVTSETDLSEGGLNQIIVYAERKSRGQELQRVPMAITAVDSRVLEQSRAVDIRDVGRLVPNAQLDGVGTFPGFANFFMRGVGVSTSIRSLDPAINVVQDGMVIGYQAGAVLDTFDTESIEVLRGPQGVLFGRNASGGVVSLRSKRPSGEFGGEFKLTVGNAGTIETRSAVEGALADGNIRARFAVLTRNNNGFFTNDNEGTFTVIPTTSNVNPTGAQAAEHKVEGMPDTNEIVAKTTWVFDLSEKTTFTLMGQYLNFDDGGGPTRSFLPEGAPLRQLQTLWGYYPANTKWDVNLGTPGYTKIKGFHIIGELEQELGAGVLSAIAAYRDINYDATLHVSGDPFDVLIFPDNEEDADQFSFETRYNVDLTDSLSLLLGAYYFDMNTSVFEKRLFNLTTSTTDKRYVINLWDQDSESYAFFGNVDFKLTPELTLSAGVRYSKDKKSIHIIPLTNCPGQSFDSCPRNFLDGKDSWDDWSPRFVANWQATPDILAYASYSRGYRSGQFNARAPSAGGAVTPVMPETVDSFEVGFKSDLMDDKVRINLNYFRQKYDDIQRIVMFTIPGESPLQQLLNAASATIQGFELETAFVPVKGFRIDANLGYTDAKYDSFNNLTGLQPGQEATDLKFDRVPKWTGYIGATYDLDLGVDELIFRAGYTWRSKAFLEVLNNPYLAQEAYGLVDASVTYNHDRWTFGIFGRNLANKEYAEIKSAGLGYNAFGGSPRYYGAEVGLKF